MWATGPPTSCSFTKPVLMRIRFNAGPHWSYIAVVMSDTCGLGEFEQFVLLSILRLDDTAYCVSIRTETAKHTGGSVAPGALYTIL